MGCRRISTNKYRITVELGYDIFGKRKRLTKVVYGTHVEAKLKEAELYKEHYHKGERINLNNLSFKDYSNIFLDKYCKNNNSLITTSHYKENLMRINEYIGETKLNKITPIILDNLYDELSIGKKGKELKKSSIYEYYKVINVMMNQAVKWELIEYNPNTKTMKPKIEPRNKKCYDINQVKNLLKALEKHPIKYKALIMLALDSGARRSEICALKWSDIDFESRTMSITKSLKIVRGTVDEERTKTKSSIREIILTSSTIEVLKEYKKWQDDYIVENKKEWINENRVFTSKNGKHMYPSTCDKILSKVIKKNNLKQIAFHELRHTTTSLLISKGINPKTVSQRLGHANTNITMDIYTHVYEDSKLECSNLLQKVLEN